jgi:hypothetical protein
LFQEELYRIPAQVTIVVSRPWHKILEDEKALLTKILGSVRISMDGVAIMFREKVSMEMIEQLNPGKVLIFGVPVAPDVKPYEYARFSDHELIRADDLNQLDEVRKKNLWLALKQMFQV